MVKAEFYTALNKYELKFVSEHSGSIYKESASKNLETIKDTIAPQPKTFNIYTDSYKSKVLKCSSYTA